MASASFSASASYRGDNGYPLSIARQMGKKAKPSDRIKLLGFKKIKLAIANRDAFHRAFAEPIIQTIQKQVNEIFTSYSSFTIS
ncbi:hypothetical protein [Hydrococcus rivularis]|uniref:hypothetical protein n=1 Tax=Hydrococcus rivularis TaxID=1616834 RepID=UPI001114FC4A|nr:hypothetical protein [Hydrococcus rivularis]